MAELTENRVKHLEMIQAVISRMASESARMKQFGLAAVGILASTAEATDAPALALVGALLALIFWALDARYLQQERLFRGHYDEIRGEIGETDFRMDPSDAIKAKHTAWGAFIGWSTSLIYGALLVVSLFLAFAVEPTVAGS
ncbi:MAG: hypothetical protein QNJ44_11280 [Rhodobacter sp.]|nr:hypothetical protein [Rhodobacter sp.]